MTKAICRKKASVLLQIIIWVGLVIIIMMFIRDRSAGTLNLKNTGSVKSPYQMDLRAFDPQTLNQVANLPLPEGSIPPGGEIMVPLDGLVWRRVNIEIWDTYKNTVIPGDSQTVFVMPGGATLIAKLSRGASGSGWQVSGWNLEQ